MSNSTQAMTVAVTGATGFVGRHVVATLLDRGHTVRALVRDPEKAWGTLPSSDRVARIRGDVFDPRALASLLQGTDAVVHTIGIRREGGGAAPGVTFERMHPRATQAVIDAMRLNAASRSTGGAGAKGSGGRIVHVSALGTRPDAPSDYWRTKYDAELIVRRSGFDWTIVRPSIIHGHDGEFVEMVRDWVLGRAAPRFFLPYFAKVEPPKMGLPPTPPRLTSALVQPVHVDDVASAIVDALERDTSIGELYTLTGPDTVDWPTLLTTIRDAMPMGDKNKKPRPIPAPIGVCAARAAKALGLDAALPFGPSEPLMASEDSVASHEKARAHLGFTPRGFKRSVAQYSGQI